MVEESSVVTHFTQNKFVRGPNLGSSIEDAKNIVYRPFALK